MAAFRLLVLGPVRLIGPGGLAVPDLGVKAQALLAYVATQPDRRGGRERLARLLWDGDGGRHALRQALLVLRRRLGEDAGSAVEIDAGTVALGRKVETDLAHFADALARGEAEAACALWRGPFCEGLDPDGPDFDEWLASERAQLDERAAGAFAEVARRAEADGRLGVAISAARQLVALDPFDDAAQARLIALYRRQGWTGAARMAHRRCVGLFHRELGIAPGAAVQVAARAPVAPRSPSASTVAAEPAATGRPGWGQWVTAAVVASLIVVAAVLASGSVAPEPAVAAAAWVDASEWRADARPDTRGLPLAAAVERALAGDRAFAHLLPGGC